LSAACVVLAPSLKTQDDDASDAANGSANGIASGCREREVARDRVSVGHDLTDFRSRRT
jgi:hypothetical protein